MQDHRRAAATLRRPYDGGSPAIPEDVGGFYPRWAVLAAILSCVFGLLGYGVWLSFQHRVCTASLGLCRIDTMPGWFEVVLIWLLFTILVLIISALGPSRLEAPDPNRGPLARATIHVLRDLTDFEAMRWFLAGTGGVGALGIAVMVYTGHLVPVALAYCGITIYVALCTLLYDAESHRVVRDARDQERARYDLKSLLSLDRSRAQAMSPNDTLPSVPLDPPTFIDPYAP